VSAFAADNAVPALTTKSRFIGELARALDERRGYAAGKLGQTERALLGAEALWSRSGKRWFEPAAVEAVEFPYGFATTIRTRDATALGRGRGTRRGGLPARSLGRR
jgi:hypothetical protein